MKTIEIVVSPKGEIQLQTRGFFGAECREASAFLEKSLGLRTAERLTDEFHQSAVTSQSLEERR